jgi:hypothetical protein
MKLYSKEQSALIQELREAKSQCPLPDLMRHLRMKKYIQRLCSSPFRVDHNPSWGIYRNANGNYKFKDLGTGDGGDEISFLARLLNIDEQQNFRDLVTIYSAIVAEQNLDENAEESGDVAPEVKQPRVHPNKSPFKPGTDVQIQKLAALRGINATALQWAQERGVLVFGTEFGHEVYGVVDQSRELVEIRRLDGEAFPELGKLKERKSHAIKNSDKAWPVGILEAKPYPCIALVEGLPDFLAAHDFILREQASGGDISTVKCAPVGVLSANVKISDDALPLFAGKIVRIFSHGDEAGVTGAVRWKNQLEGAGARQVAIFDFTLVSHLTGVAVNDLNDLLKLIDTEPLKNIPSLQKIIPHT